MLSSVISALEQSSKNKVNKNNESDFCAEYRLGLQDLQLEVKNIGKLAFPLTEEVINTLKTASTPSKVGLRAQTLLDKNIRDSHEIAADQLTITVDEKKFAALLQHVNDKLQISQSVTLRAHLHNLLIYSPGQFFLPHQDSEKLEGMVATLVIVLPFPHIGGDLVINHKNQTKRLVSETLASSDLPCMAFYADCKHEVEKVKQGHRIALTYNLVAEAINQPDHHQSSPELVQSLQEYFQEEVLPNKGLKKLVYLLDHQYTEHSLQWALLKANDWNNARALRAAAKQLDLISHLALVTVQESWIAEGDEQDPNPSEFIDSSMTFSTWFDEQGKRLGYGDIHVQADELCWTTETADMEPDDFEYEGWMGNYGNTVNYWYRRAAVILWRQRDQAAMSFKLDFDHALKNVLDLTNTPGNEQEVAAILIKARDDLRTQDKISLSVLVKLACYIQNQDLAASLVDHLLISCINHTNAHELVLLQNTYGEEWCLGILRQWSDTSVQKNWNRDRGTMLTSFDKIIQKLRANNVSIKLVEFLREHQFVSIVNRDKEKPYRQPSAEKQAINERVRATQDFLEACFLTEDVSFFNKTIFYVIANPLLYPEVALTKILLKWRKRILEPSAYKIQLLHEHVLKGVKQEVDQGLREETDWSIKIEFPCSCEHCTKALQFLRSSTETDCVWPLAQEGRNHIMRIFGTLELPVTLSVEEKGSPYKLVMHKTDKIFKDAQERFQQVQRCYHQLVE